MLLCDRSKPIVRLRPEQEGKSLPRRIAIWSAKGGSGKTTCTLHLAAALAERDARVLLIDVDPQAGLTRLLHQKRCDGFIEALSVPTGLAPILVPTEIAGVHALAANPDLSAAQTLAAHPSPDGLLDDALGQLAPGRWDFVLLDCGPGVDRLTILALSAAREHLAPIEPEPLSLGSLPDSLDLADAVRKRLAPRLAPSRILLSRVRDDPGSIQRCEELRDRFSTAVLAGQIPEDAALRCESPPTTFHRSDRFALAAFDRLAGELLEEPRCRPD